jgi:hypothetical protein
VTTLQLARVGCALALAVSVAACASDDDTAASVEPTSEIEASPSAEAEPPLAGSSEVPTEEAGAQQTVSTFVLTSSTTDGFSGRVTVRFGELVPAGAAEDPGFPVPRCFDSVERSALIPFEIEFTNTTSGFTASVPFQLRYLNQHNTAVTLTTQVDDECLTSDMRFGSPTILNLAPELPPATSTMRRGWVNLDDFYSPSEPNGNADFLSGFAIGLSAQGRSYKLEAGEGFGQPGAPIYVTLDGGDPRERYNVGANFG